MVATPNYISIIVTTANYKHIFFRRESYGFLSQHKVFILIRFTNLVEILSEQLSELSRKSSFLYAKFIIKTSYFIFTIYIYHSLLNFLQYYKDIIINNYKDKRMKAFGKSNGRIRKEKIKMVESK